MLRRLLTTGAAMAAVLGLTAGPAVACGGLIGRNGAVNLLRTSTLAGYANGVEHYVTSFQFAGGGAEFGSIVPLPGVPTNVEKGGEWTLQRLVRETTPPAPSLLADSAGGGTAARAAQVLIDVDIDALDVTVLKGGAVEVGTWAREQGFRLPPDAPEVLDFYARRSPIFMAVRFDPSRAAARDQRVGEGTPIHLTIPTTNPWVPLRILGLGKQAVERVEADVYLLTERRPALLPAPNGGNGMRITYDQSASDSLLTDLRTDKGGAWVPARGWLTKVAVDAAASQMTYDLAIDASGQGTPSFVAAGLALPDVPADERSGLLTAALLAALAVTTVLTVVVAGPLARRLPREEA